MMPGVSRAAASIIGGMQQKLTRSAAAEFSFFLAVPTMLAVTTYSVFLKKWHVGGVEQKGISMITADNSHLIAFLTGNLVAFVVAAFAIRFFIGFLKRYGFRMWGWYRIIAGLAMLAFIYFRTGSSGWELKLSLGGKKQVQISILDPESFCDRGIRYAAFVEVYPVADAALHLDQPLHTS
jgi:hypothetical protein